MPITPRCNYAGPLGQAIPTRSLAASLTASLTASVAASWAAALAAIFRLRR